MIRGLEKIKSMDEYNSVKKDLEYYISEYKWISDEKITSNGLKNHKEEAENELKACMQQLHFGMEKEEELNLLAKIQVLKTKCILIANDKYKPALKSNINGLVLMMEEFEASHQGLNFKDVIKGALKGDKETKEYLKKKYMFTLANMYGTAPAPESLNVESMDDILDYMERTYDFVDIDLSDRVKQNETALITYEEPVVGIRAQIIEAMNKEAENCIKQLGDSINENKRNSLEQNASKTDVELSKKQINDKVKNNKVKNDKNKGEIDR